MPVNVKRRWDNNNKQKKNSQKWLLSSVLICSTKSQRTLSNHDMLFSKFSLGKKKKKNQEGFWENLGGGEVSGYRDGVNEEPLQEATDCWWIWKWAIVLWGGGGRLNKGEDDEEISSAPKREFSKNVELSGTVRMNAAGSSTVVLSRPFEAPSSSSSSTLHHNITSTFTKWEEGGRRWGGGGKRRKNAPATWGKKGEDEEGAVKLWLESFVGLMESVQLPEWLKFTLFNDLLLARGYFKTTTEWILLYFCDIKLLILVPIYSRKESFEESMNWGPGIWTHRSLISLLSPKEIKIH